MYGHVTVATEQCTVFQTEKESPLFLHTFTGVTFSDDDGNHVHVAVTLQEVAHNDFKTNFKITLTLD